MGSGLLPVRRVRFEYPDDLDPSWSPHLPEFAAAANAISLGMPYAEPLFIKAVRSTLGELDEGLRARTETYIRQEVGHYTQHKKLNEIIVARYPSTLRLQGWMEAAANFIWRRSKRFNVAYAAAGETLSYGVARWAESHAAWVMDRADPVVASLFMWHLAEEVEHKSSTYDVFEATDGSKLRYAWALTVAFLSLCIFTTLGTLMQLWADRRLRYPATWFRLARLALSVGFTVLPVMVVSVMPGHHPRQFADPVLLPRWMRDYDPATGRVPLWCGAGTRSSSGGASR
ncbi:MAG: metal-dependent hydrolase [Acidimicrobiales bacterium]|nr:metal-dependent hydrolase [Acidimicrobiales bacterium]